MSKAIPPVSFVAPGSGSSLGEIFNMEVQEVVATGKTPVVRRKAPVRPRHVGAWSDLNVGNIVKVQDEESTFFFLLSDIRPTRNRGSFAWLQGKRVNATGHPVKQIDHLHLPEGERQEFTSLEAITLYK